MSSPEGQFRFDLSGGHLALDFANTVSHSPPENRKERLPDYRSLIAFGEQSGVLPVSAAKRLSSKTGKEPAEVQRAWQNAIRLREALFEIFLALAEQRAIPAQALAILNAALLKSASHGHIVSNSGGFRWEWIGQESDCESVLWPVARSAAELLTSEELANLRICASEKCAWLFLDKSKNHRRRWCDMKTCGNRVKAQRHYQRVRAS
jgi:predicted RNA-binding Zn ribbon-like protein